MQSWQIKILELEQTVLSQLSGFIAQHKLGAFLALFYVLMAAGIVFIVLVCRGQRRNPRRERRNPPVIFIEMPGSPPPPPDDFNPFPPPHHYRHCDCDDEHWD